MKGAGKMRAGSGAASICKKDKTVKHMTYHIEFIRKAKELADIMTNVYLDEDPLIDGAVFQSYCFEDFISELGEMTEKIEIELRDLYTRTDEKIFGRHLSKFHNDIIKLIENVSEFNTLGFDPEKDLNIDLYSPMKKAEQAKFFHIVLGRLDAHIRNEYQEQDTFLPSMDINTHIEKLILLHETKIFEFIVNKYGLDNQPAKTVALFASLIGIKPDTNEYKTFASNVRKLNSQPETLLETKSKKPTKNLTKIKAELIKIGIEIK
jgi:hypothetical protein